MTGSWKLVPVEPVNAMENAGVDEGANNFGLGVDEGQVSATWRAMHKAAPAPPEDVLERMARAFLNRWHGVRIHLSSAQVSEAKAAMRAALTAAEEPKPSASVEGRRDTSNPSAEGGHE